ncbi:MAG: hypothetical protein ICV72_04745, partial [Aldersonia sp.]|nr:hypothetical protein [Aldersonia sp.]
MRRRSALAAGMGLATMVSWVGVASASVDELPVRVRLAQEFLPAGDVDAHTDEQYLTWAQSRRRHRDRFDAYLSVGDRPKIRLNTRGQGWAGGIDVAGGVVAYQQARRGDSDIRIYRLRDGRRTTAGRRVSSDRHWEYDPAVSGRWLVFARLNWRARPDVRKVLLYDRFAGTRPTVLAGFVGGHRKGTLVNADVDGDWVTWTRCRHRFEICEVFRYQISTGDKVVLPHPAEHLHYASSIEQDGTVYYMESGLRCGVQVTIRRHAIDGTDQ